MPVVPAYIRGTPETNDVFKALFTPSHARVVFGSPIDLSRFVSSEGEYDKSLLGREKAKAA